MHTAHFLVSLFLACTTGLPAMAAKKVTPPLCQSLLHVPSVWTSVDYELVEKSRNGPVLSGYAHPTTQYVKRWGGKVTDKVNEWHLYFIADESQPCFDSPSETVKKVKPLFDRVATKAALSQEIFGPLHIFMTCQDFKFSIPLAMPGKWSEESDEVFKIFGGAAIKSSQGIRIRIGDRIQEFDFGDHSPIIILKAGDEKIGSTWQDEFVMAHEAAHQTEHNSFLPKYFKEARADFRAAVNSGRTASPLLGSERDVANPEFRNLDEFFSKISPTASYQQLGSFIAYSFFKMWPHIQAYNLEHSSHWFFQRLMNLIKFESEDMVRDGMNHFPADKVSYSKAEVIRRMNFIAGISMQVSVEQGWPLEVTKKICDQWSPLGVRGPFKRVRIHDVKRDGTRVLGDYDDEFKNLHFPEQWNTCADLISYLM